MKGQRIYTQKIKHENPSQKKTYSPLYTDISKGSKYRFKRSNQSWHFRSLYILKIGLTYVFTVSMLLDLKWNLRVANPIIINVKTLSVKHSLKHMDVKSIKKCLHFIGNTLYKYFFSLDGDFSLFSRESMSQVTINFFFSILDKK